MLEITDLKPDLTYKIRLWRTWGKNDTYYLESSVPYEANLTVPSSALVVPSLKVKNMIANAKGCDVFITWEPAEGW